MKNDTAEITEGIIARVIEGNRISPCDCAEQARASLRARGFRLKSTPPLKAGELKREIWERLPKGERQNVN